MKRIFFSQSMLDTMVEAGQIRLEGAVLTLLSGDNRSFELKPAFRIVRTADNTPDPYDLSGQIKSASELRELGAETYLDSVIYRDAAYQAEPGYIGEQQELADRLSDTELLSKFLLDNLL